jgi:PAS domain S-box-containing protein
VDQSIRATFAAGSSERIEIHNEYLDTSSVRNDSFKQLQVDFLRQKYAGRKVDLVIAGLSSALDFVLEHRARIFPGVPIVFCAVDQREVAARQLGPDVIGVPIKMDLTATLDLALHLHPNTEHVFVIAGNAKFDADWVSEARQSFRAYANKLEFSYLTKLRLEDLLQEVSHLPERSIIYYLHVHQDDSGKVLVPAEVLALLAPKANAPIYGHVDSYVGRGMVGGCVFSWPTEGSNAAKLGLRILAGEKPASIGVQKTSANTPMFDWRQLQRWGIREGSLPPGSVVRHRQPSFWDLYRWHISGMIALCVVQALLIVGLLVQRANRRRAEERFLRAVSERKRADIVLRESENRFRLMADTAPVMVWMSGPDKLCTYFNKPWLDFTGRPLEREVGHGWSEGVHADDLQRCLDTYVQAFDARQSFRMEYRLRRFDGEYRRVLDTGVPRFKSDGTFDGYIGSCLDITEEKRVEEALRENQRELRVLTGRLLQAQETERSRIARELHDDLNQSLALLSVELDRLGQKTLDSPPEFGQWIRELSAQVKRLSASVHDLSHQLHPSKLEQLGLVAAVRALCKELTQTHGVPIEFTPRRVPEKIPEDTALCLYRIVQEALRNVIKHSAAHRAHVDLDQSADTLCLRIADDGTGFDPAKIPGGSGLGLVSMRERLRLVRGQIAIDSRPSCGTRIDVRVPLCGNGQAKGALPAHRRGIRCG